MVLCEICNTPFRIINDAYVCDEGHTVENKIEVANEMSDIKPSVIEGKKITTHVVGNYGSDYTNLLVFHLLFEEMKSIIGFKSSKYLDIYINFFKEEAGKRLTGPPISIHTLRALTYYSKRIKMEAEGKTYLYLEHAKAMERYSYDEKVTRILDEMNLRESFSGLVVEGGCDIHSPHLILRYLGEADFEFRPGKYRSWESRHTETGVLDEEGERNKTCFRQDLRRDYHMFLEYLKRICGIFELDISKDLERRFKIFFYASDFTRTVHIPEMEISVFLYIEIMNYKRDFNVGKAIKNVRINLLGSFWNEGLNQNEFNVCESSKMEKYCNEQNTFQSNIKFLLYTISLTNETDFKEALKNLRSLFDNCDSATRLRSFRRRRAERHKIIFNHSVWYIRKLMFARRNNIR